jgi:hypothetical protein
MLLEIWTGMFFLDPGSVSRIWIFSHPGSRGQKSTAGLILFCLSHPNLSLLLSSAVDLE